MGAGLAVARYKKGGWCPVVAEVEAVADGRTAATAAAIGNALAAAVGVRVRDLPLTAERCSAGRVTGRARPHAGFPGEVDRLSVSQATRWPVRLP